MGFYDRVVFPRLMHFGMRAGEISKYRRRVVPAAAGRMLKVGIGSGLNLPFYTGEVTEIVGIDPHETLDRMAEKRRDKALAPVSLVSGTAEDMPFDDKDFDTVVTTWTLCGVPDGMKALGEMRRVLKPGGHLVFIEHGQAPIWKPCAGGCHLNRPIGSMIRDSGFTLTDLETGYLKGPRFAAYCFWGRARP